jgi:hypothetical protein
MSSFSALHLVASASLLIAVSGCNLEKLELADSIVPPAAAASASVPMDFSSAGHEIHRMFDNEKRDAVAVELAPQF